MKTLASATLFVILAIAAAVVGVIGWLAWEIGNRAIAALDGIGPGIFQAGALVTFGAFVFVVTGASVAFVRFLALRSRSIHPHDNGLYPMQYHGPANYLDLNADKAQVVATLSSGRRASAATVGRVLDWQPQPFDVPALPEPTAHYPARVDVYDAALPRALALPVGVAGDGRPVALPLRGLGNVVIGGLPNYGKSELLASMAAGLLRQDATGERQQIAVVDMKLVSFGNLPDLAGLRWPVATDIDEAHEVIAAARAECSRRYEVLRDARARTLEEYQTVTGEPLPYLTVLVDEIADLTCDDDRGRRERFLSSAMQIARQGRAAGVGLVMATQRPSADVLPSSLRNLAGAAVAFRVQRNHDSIAILGEPGAETLPAVPGRCLVKHSGVVQVQAFYAGLEGGRFDAFVAQLPTGEPALPAPAWPVRTDTVPVYRPETALQPGIPVFSTDDRATYTAEQIAHIRDRYAALGSLKAVERELYGQDGGYWFYRLKEVLS